MSGWKDLLLDTLRLTDEVKRLNEETQKLSDQTLDINKRVVRLETIIKITGRHGGNKQID